MAKMFEDDVRNFALMCFKIKPHGGKGMTKEDADEANRELMERLNRDGKATGSTRWSWRQEERHAQSVLELINKTTTEIMEEQIVAVVE
ncbi:unnamed protein product [Miscanthus lutarioriparius]|uniref:Uncharacterized protein n=1 Tax=Miscanthus lutarioriparius TaxID=422564 RepID=A0A811PGU9_9POAL|nr:unnamed protein product [Miscanthus lutarioriparius]